jgi:hypothetical protein
MFDEKDELLQFSRDRCSRSGYEAMTASMVWAVDGVEHSVEPADLPE